MGWVPPLPPNPYKLDECSRCGKIIRMDDKYMVAIRDDKEIKTCIDCCRVIIQSSGVEVGSNKCLRKLDI